MARTAQVVIGAGYGDEGKGLCTDAFVARHVSEGRKPWVVRFNGGAQAGHTVHASGVRHVFHHWGSGALAGAPTFLGAEFVCHPMLFHRESQVLRSHGACLEMRVDSRARITLPYDMLINQAIEQSRGHSRHGSCGVGFGEAIQRSLLPQFDVRMSDLYDRIHLRNIMDRVRHDYVPQRLEDLGLSSTAIDALRWDDELLEMFLGQALEFGRLVQPCRPEVLKQADAVVFEGAQGLLLDEELGAFPYVTRSKTGLPYAVALAEEAGLEHLETTYLTRCYVTRHGAGPLSGEVDAPPVPGFDDATNRPNAFQGSLRFAPLDVDILASTIAADLRRVSSTHVGITHGLMVGCLDQAGGHLDVVMQGQTTTLAIAEIPPLVATRIGAGWVCESHGPTRATWKAPQALHRPRMALA